MQELLGNEYQGGVNSYFLLYCFPSQTLLLPWKLVSGLQIQVDLVASSCYVNPLSY